MIPLPLLCENLYVFAKLTGLPKNQETASRNAYYCIPYPIKKYLAPNSVFVD